MPVDGQDENCAALAPYPEKLGKCESYKPSELLSRVHEMPPNDKEFRGSLIDELFDYHPWNEEQKRQGEWVNRTLKHAYQTIVEYVPVSRSRTRALNALTDARMLANQAITFKGKV
jgi:hypothetical protein